MFQYIGIGREPFMFILKCVIGISFLNAAKIKEIDEMALPEAGAEWEG